jgi:hypothetical protein
MDQNGGFLAFQTSPGVQGVGHRWLACGHEPFKKFMPGEKSVQQHSGDWTKTGKVPVARVRKR